MRGRVHLDLVDAQGHPLEGRVADVLRQCAPTLRRDFPDLGDDVDFINVLEEGYERITAREIVYGPVQRLRAYVRRTLRHIAISRMRLLPHRFVHESLSDRSGQSVLEILRSPWHTPEQIELRVLMREVAAWLTPDENAVCNLRQQGYSYKEIAHMRGCTVDAVTTMHRRAILKMQKIFQARQPPRIARRSGAQEDRPVMAVKTGTAGAEPDDDDRTAE
jgi:RNA polymerase sigma factor (sigma-70 family)